MIPVGLQLYSVKNEMANDFEGTIKKVAISFFTEYN